MNFIEKLLKENSHVHVHDDKRIYVEEVIHSLINDGRSMLHIVADFDFTLTMYEKDGKTLPSTFGVIEQNDRVRVRISIILTFYSKIFMFLVTRWFITSRYSRSIKIKISSN
jgi:hypothetical protein